MFQANGLCKVQRDKRRPLLQKEGLPLSEDGSLIYFHFEIEYRTSHTIKRDTNSGFGIDPSVLSSLQTYNTSQPQMNYQQQLCFSVSGTSEFFSEVPDCLVTAS